VRELMRRSPRCGVSAELVDAGGLLEEHLAFVAYTPGRRVAGKERNRPVLLHRLSAVIRESPPTGFAVASAQAHGRLEYSRSQRGWGGRSHVSELFWWPCISLSISTMPGGEASARLARQGFGFAAEILRDSPRRGRTS
jgi:hypothetical protein